jgi:hypothetical protein
MFLTCPYIEQAITPSTIRLLVQLRVALDYSPILPAYLRVFADSAEFAMR